MKRPTMKDSPAFDAGPSLRAIPFGATTVAGSTRLLNETHRRHLGEIATLVDLKPPAIVYRADSPAEFVYIVAAGVMKITRDLPSGKRRITAFIFAEDIFGLAENGRYVSTARTVTAATLYRIPVGSLELLLSRDPELPLQFLCKVTHELRESQRQTLIVGRRDAVGRVAMFVKMLERRGGSEEPQSEVPIPMSRTDIANYLGMSLEAVVRASRVLEHHGIVAFPNRHRAVVLNRGRLDRLAANH